MMKKITFLLVLATAILMWACSKNSPGSGGGNNNGGNGGNGGNGNNGGNGGNNSGITVTSISPVSPYPDDEITLNGTGFNTDATKDTVEFGHMMGNAFTAWYDGSPSDWASPADVKSASSTQLVIKPVNSFSLDFSSFATPGTPSIAVVRVKTGGHSAIMPIPFKRLLLFGYLENPDDPTKIGRPNDSLLIGGKGFAKSGIAVAVDGKTLTNVKVDSTPDNGTITLRMSKTFFGNVNDETLQELKTVKITNPDGKSEQKDFYFYLSPKMHIDIMSAENKTYSKSGLTGAGGVIKITVKGKCLKDDCIVKIVSNSGINSQSGWQVTGLPDSTMLQFTPGALNTGNYTVSILRGTVVYGACGFTLNP